MSHTLRVAGAIGVVICVITLCWTNPAFAGGGGQNVLMVVNPNDENAVRIASEYQRIRNIPDSNVIFIAPPSEKGYTPTQITESVLRNTYAKPIISTIAARGLSNQIDYIATFGQPQVYRTAVAYNNWNARYAFNYGLMAASIYNQIGSDKWIPASGKGNTPLYQGTIYSDVQHIYTLAYQQGQNAAVHHSTTYTDISVDGVPFNANYFMSGAIGYTGILGNNAAQVISNLQRTAAADGTKPVGTIYFEENNDVRSNAREYQWPAVKSQLTARGIPWVQETSTPGNAPLNRSDVRGAVLGWTTPVMPNGSTYLPGSWADNLTSFGATFGTSYQTKVSDVIRAGAAATCGTVVEPYADSDRFTDASVHLFIADGSTMGESFVKSVRAPVVQMFLGDLLSQPYADVPNVQFTSGPSNGSTVSGTVQFGASAGLTTPTLATGIKQLELYIDGKYSQMVSSATGIFDVNTANLTDGRHEIRLVAVNNAQAESQNVTIREVYVNNLGRSVAVTGGSLQLTANQVSPITVAGVAGGGTVSRIELRQMGRSIGQVAGTGGTINLDATKLAFGDNTIIPVEVFSDGKEVAGAPVIVHRAQTVLAGTTPTPLAQRTPGFRGEYFFGKGATSIAASNFSGTPNITQTFNYTYIASGSNNVDYWYTRPHLIHPAAAVAALNNLAFRLSGNFIVPASKVGEWYFTSAQTNDSVQLMIDGVPVFAYDDSESGFVNAVGSVSLGEGMHLLEILTANTVTSSYANAFNVAIFYRDTDGITKMIDENLVFVPEPAAMLILLAGGMLVRRKKQRNLTA